MELPGREFDAGISVSLAAGEVQDNARVIASHLSG
jgi:hypothetical protein